MGLIGKSSPAQMLSKFLDMCATAGQPSDMMLFSMKFIIPVMVDGNAWVTLTRLRRYRWKLLPPVWLLSTQGIACNSCVKALGPFGSSVGTVHERGHPYGGVESTRGAVGSVQPHVTGQNARVLLPVIEASWQ
jgi:hypothetical protein